MPGAVFEDRARPFSGCTVVASPVWTSANAPPTFVQMVTAMDIVYAMDTEGHVKGRRAHE